MNPTFSRLKFVIFKNIFFQSRNTFWKKLATLEKEFHSYGTLFFLACPSRYIDGQACCLRHANAKFTLEYKFYSSQWLQSSNSNKSFLILYTVIHVLITRFWNWCLFLHVKAKVQLFLHTKKTVLHVLKLQSFFHLRRVFLSIKAEEC